MKVVKPRDKDEFKRVIAEAREKKLLIYIAAYPCPECEVFEAALEELKVDTAKIVKVDVPADDWAVDFVLNELKVPGSPTVVLPDGSMIDDPDPVEMALKVKQLVEKD